VKVIYPARVFHGFLLLASVPVTYWKRWRSARGFHNIWPSAQAYIGTARCRGVEHFNPWPFWCLLDVVGPVLTVLLLYSTGWWFQPFFIFHNIWYGNNHPSWLIFSEGLEPPTSLCHSYVDYIDPFRCCWYSLQAHFEKNRRKFLLFSTVRSAHGPVFICRSWQARMRRRREHQYNHYQEEEDNLRKLKEAWAIGSLPGERSWGCIHEHWVWITKRFGKIQVTLW
jgi:hypothetical protein